MKTANVEALAGLQSIVAFSYFQRTSGSSDGLPEVRSSPPSTDRGTPALHKVWPWGTAAQSA